MTVSGTRPRCAVLRRQMRRPLICALVFLMFLTPVFVYSLQQKPSETIYHFPPYPPVYPAPPPMPTVQRAPPGSNDTRVELITVGTSVNNMMCAHWASSVLSGRSTTVAGYGKKRYTHRDKLVLLNRAIALKGMRDWDVVVYLDQDTVFTGEDLQSYIDDFIRRSPVHPDDINVREIRRGTMAAPLRLSTDPVCFAPSSLKSLPECTAHFDAFDAAVNEYAATHTFKYTWEANVTRANARTNDLYVNSGFYMARVWAFRELLMGQTRFLPEFPHRGFTHTCDQSIYVGLYMDLRWSEMRLGLLEEDVKRPHTPTVNQMGLHYGLIDIWRVRPPAVLAHVHGVPANRIDASLYGLPFNTSMPEMWVPPAYIHRTVSGILNAVPSPPQARIRRVPPAHSSTHVTTDDRSLRIAPSLLGMSPRMIDRTEQGGFPSRFAPVLHFADHPKDPRVHMYLPFFGWYIAMDLEPGQRDRSTRILRSAVVSIVDHGADKLTTLAIGEKCGAWIDEFILNGTRVY